jgi:hypothetical protein
MKLWLDAQLSPEMVPFRGLRQLEETTLDALRKRQQLVGQNEAPHFGSPFRLFLENPDQIAKIFYCERHLRSNRLSLDPNIYG